MTIEETKLEEILSKELSLCDSCHLKDSILNAMKQSWNAAIKWATENAETYEYPCCDVCPECGKGAVYVNEESITKGLIT